MKPAALIGFNSLTARKALEGAFGAAGFRTVSCASAPEARAALERNDDIAVAVVEPSLSDGGANEVLRAVAANPARPVLTLVDADRSDGKVELPSDPMPAPVRFLGSDWDPSAVAHETRDALSESRPSKAALRVLAVDDSATFRAQLEEQLAAAGYGVETAASGEEALKKLESGEFDAVLLDMIMPGMDGVQTCRLIRAIPKHRVTPVLMLTAMEGTEPVLSALHAGADDFVRKSGEQEILQARLRAHLRRKRYEDENREIREALHQQELELSEQRSAQQLAETQSRLLSHVERKNRELAQAVRARDEFVSIASHELKTPLTSMLMHVQSLRSTPDDTVSPRVHRKLEVIDRQVHRLNALVAELLDIARITGGRLALTPEEVDVSRLVDEVVVSFEHQLHSAGCEIRVRAEPGLVGHWDRGRIEQVLSNLISNAVKYGPCAPIHIDVRRVDGSAEITVRDRGIGIPPEAQARIFERFERAVSVRQYGGFGLGLWIARQIIEAHQGSISVESRPGQGSTFRVRLPLQPAKLESAPASL